MNVTYTREFAPTVNDAACVATEAGLALGSHQLHLFRGLHAVAMANVALAPETDALLSALQEERLRVSFSTAQPLIDPRALPATLDKLLQDMVNLPQKIDEVLTLAADGRLRVKLHLPYDDTARRFNFLAGLGFGAVLGVGLAMLATPQKKVRLRRRGRATRGLHGDVELRREGAERHLPFAPRRRQHGDGAPG